MNRIAQRADYQHLSSAQKVANAAVLKACEDHRLSCRCEMSGDRDFTIIVAPGLSSATYWISKLDVDVTADYEA